MKKLSIVLPMTLCLGVSFMSISPEGIAQPAEPIYNRILDQSKQSIKGENYEAAEKSAQKSLLIAKSPQQTGDALVVLGETFYRRNMYTQARIEWSKAVALDDPGNNDFRMVAHLGLARNYKAEGDETKAIAEYEQVFNGFSAKPGSNVKQEGRTIISLALADAYLKSEEFDLARSQFNQIFDDHKDEPEISSIALFNLGKIDFIQNNFKQALDTFNQVLSMKGVTPAIKRQTQADISAVMPLLPLEEKAKAPNGSPIKIKIVDQIGEKIDALVDAVVLQAF